MFAFLAGILFGVMSTVLFCIVYASKEDDADDYKPEHYKRPDDEDDE